MDDDDIDMYMDTDIPLPEELELLESNARLLEDFPDPGPPEPYPYEHQISPPQQPKSPPHLPSDSQIHLTGHKRSISEAAELSEEKRLRNDETAAPAADEDWLRYSPPRGSEPVAAEEEMAVEEKVLSRFASEIEGECMPITAPNGDRVYAKLDRFVGEERVKKLDARARANSDGLIFEPINILFEKLDQEAFTKALEASSECQNVLDVIETPIVREQLWVDKYAPTSFTELLSDEHTNREVLLWLKQWDSRVFRSEICSTSEEVLSALKRHSTVVQNKKPVVSKFQRMSGGPKWSNDRYRHSKSMDEISTPKSFQDISNRKAKHTGPPEHKILLLCGPPGLGKTTLAHVVARHCGYDVLEVNASDDRNTSSIESKLHAAVEMNKILSDSRPMCLVVDEIDGALSDGKGAVEVLLKMVSAEKKSDVGKENLVKEQSGKRSSKNGHKKASLSRPVICICNDLYAPALRPLRQVAKVHIFVQPTVSRVVSRLKYICNKEGMKVNAIALTALAEYTECDIRSCLNTLQFLCKKKETLNMFDIGSQVVGRKDMSKNVLDIWKEVFQRKKTKAERKSPNSKPFEVNSLYSVVSSRGDYDLILDGIHENILQLNYHDPVMQKTVKCLNSLGVSDLLHQYIMRTQQMSLQVYLPPVAITVHRTVAQIQKPNIEWPRSYLRYRTKMAEKMDILNTWHHKISPSIARHLSTSSFVEDIISPLLHIMSPPTIKPVALQLLSDREKSDLAQLVSTMVSYSITYKSMKPDVLPNGLRREVVDHLTLSIDPPMCDFINFKDYTSNHYELAPAVKQILVHEVEKQKILLVKSDRPLGNGISDGRPEHIEAGTSNAQSSKINPADAISAKNIQHESSVTKTRKNNANATVVSQNSHPNKGAANNMKSQNTGRMRMPSSGSFFDRFRKLNSKGIQSDDSAEQKEAEKAPHPLLFKYNEGFTNAVKRPVRMREFLL